MVGQSRQVFRQDGTISVILLMAEQQLEVEKKISLTVLQKIVCVNNWCGGKVIQSDVQSRE